MTWLTIYLIGWLMCFLVAWAQIHAWNPSQPYSNVVAAMVVALAWPLVLFMRLSRLLFGIRG